MPLPENFRNLWDVPNLLLQKFSAPEFTVTTRLTFTPRTDEEEIGLIVMGLDYAYLSVKQKTDSTHPNVSIAPLIAEICLSLLGWFARSSPVEILYYRYARRSAEVWETLLRDVKPYKGKDLSACSILRCAYRLRLG